MLHAGRQELGYTNRTTKAISIPTLNEVQQGSQN